MKIQQLAVGISLLAVAFFLGRMMNQRSDSELDQQSPELVRTDETGQSTVTDIPNAIAQQDGVSLLDRLKKRSGGPTPLPSARKSPFSLPSGDSSIVREPSPAEPSGDDSMKPIDEIVTPDFSPLQFAGPDLAPAEPALLEPDQVVDDVLDRDPKDDIMIGPVDPIDTAESAATIPNRRAVAAQPETNNNPGQPNSRDSLQSRMPRTALQRVPFGLNDTAQSQLAKVHRKDHQVLLTTSQFQNHSVQSGETLQSISTLYYGRPDYYLDIYLANQDLMSNPSDMPVGRVIKVPVFSR